MQKPYETTSAHGHVMLVWDISLLTTIQLKLLLQFKYGFHREGRTVSGMGEGVARDFVCGNIRLHAGYDDMAGLYLLSDSTEADTFLREFAARWK